MTRPAIRDAKGIVHPAEAFEHFTLERLAPEAPLDRFVDRFWATAWDLPENFEQTLVTPPAVILVFEPDGTAVLSGVVTHNFQRKLEGKGWVFGLLFRPAGFRPFVDTPMSRLTDRSFPISELFGDEGDRVAIEVAEAPGNDARRRIVTDFLVDRCPAELTRGEDISALIESATGDALVTRVSDLAAQFGVSARTLQRLFSDHVGVGPKWVLDRYRVRAAAERARLPVESWADVAAQLGYADQAHLTASMSEVFGSPPAKYATLERFGVQTDRNTVEINR